jgi:hypothetical protein
MTENELIEKMTLGQIEGQTGKCLRLRRYEEPRRR